MTVNNPGNAKKIIRPSEGAQVRFLSCSTFECLYGGSKGGGKLQPLDALVLTPFGFTEMRNMKVGSQVTCPDGTVAKVIRVWDFNDQDIYKVTFNDGTSTEAGGDHLWEVWYSGSAVKNKHRRDIGDANIRAKVVTTDIIREDLERLKERKGVKQSILIPLTEPIPFTKSYKTPQITIAPYILGALLGDGGMTTSNIIITSADEEILQQFQAAGYTLKYRDRYAYSINDAKELRQELKRLKLHGTGSGTKFIPGPYKYMSVADRFALAQGLMDTDGYIAEDGGCYYTTISPQLAEDFKFVLQSLGFRVHTSLKEKTGYRDANGVFIPCQPAYTLYIRGKHQDKLFRLSRKKARLKPFNGGWGTSEPGRRIESVEWVRKADARCITLDHPRGLYLTNDFIVTHNSFCLVLDALGQVQYSDYRAVIFRETNNELKDLLDKADEMYYAAYPGVSFNKAEKCYTFPSGAKIYFSHCNNREDARKWQGVAVAFLGIDEAANFDRETYEDLKANVRYAGTQPLKCYVRLTCNPTGKGAGWLKQYFVDPAKPNTVIRDAKNPELDRMFIPATLKDNPALDGTAYRQQLEMLPEKQRRALLEGDWNAFAGAFFDLKKDIHIWTWHDFEKFYKLEPGTKIPQEWARYVSCDWGYTSPFSIGWYAVAPDGRLFLYREFCGVARDNQGQVLANQGIRKTPGDVAKIILKVEEGEVIQSRILDAAEFGVNRGDRFEDGGPTGAELFAREGVFFTKSTKERIATGCGELFRRFDYREEEDGTIKRENYPYLILIDEETTNHQRTIMTLVSSPTDPESYDSRGEDHDIDQMRYMVMSRPMSITVPEKQKRWQRNQEKSVSSDSLWALGM